MIAGNAKTFSTGLTLKVLPDLDRDGLAQFSREFMGLFTRVLEHPRPVVAAVHGPAIAGGAILALSADFRLVTPGAKVELTETPVGIPFPAPLLDLARATLPADEIAPARLQGVIREGATCVERRWAHEVVSRENLEARAVALASDLAHHSAMAFGETKTRLVASVVERMRAFEKEGAEAWGEVLAESETRETIRRYFARVTGKA